MVAAWNLGPTEQVLAHFLGRSVDRADLERFYLHAAAASRRIRPFPGVGAMLEAIRRSGRALAVFTGATRRTTDLNLGASGLARFFDVVVCGDQVTRPKPSGLGLREACRRLGVRRQDAVYVGDSAADMESAHDAGMRGIGALWGTRGVRSDAQDAVEQPDELLLHLERLPGAPTTG